MYPAPFRYHRAESLREASSMMSDLGDDAKFLAGGQSLIPLMKLRLAEPTDLIDLSYIGGLSDIREDGDTLSIGALASHAQIADSFAAKRVPAIGDCAAGIADVQVRNKGTIGGSLAEADPSGDWAPVMLTLDAELDCQGDGALRTIPMSAFVEDAFTSALGPGEIITAVRVRIPPPGSGGAYLAFKRSAQVYATASVAVQMTLDDDGTCTFFRIALGSAGLVPVIPTLAENQLLGSSLDDQSVVGAAEAAASMAEPVTDMRGSEDYKRSLIRALVKRAIGRAAQRCKGETIEGVHEYV